MRTLKAIFICSLGFTLFCFTHLNAHNCGSFNDHKLKTFIEMTTFNLIFIPLELTGTE